MNDESKVLHEQSSPETPGLFEAIGIELEYMIVDRETLDVRAFAERLLADSAGEVQNEIPRGDLSRSNELAAHVIELKNPEPEKKPERLSNLFHSELQEVIKELRPFNATLLPGPAHPWMDPNRETVLWPHGDDTIYRAYDRIFGCEGHGWSNLQSMHINLPFRGDEEFARLHAAIRLVLPLIPALAAASPFIDGESTGMADSRLTYYEQNQRKIPCITGGVIPGPYFSEQDYRNGILHRMYKRISPYDPEKILQDEWLNSRGAIARFDRNAIEIRITDIQETPFADLTIAGMITGVIQAFVEEKPISFEMQKKVSTGLLRRQYHAAVQFGSETIFEDQAFLNLFQEKRAARKASHLWLDLAAKFKGFADSKTQTDFLNIYETEGDLAHRLFRSAGAATKPSKKQLVQTYRLLSECLEKGEFFTTGLMD